MENFKIREKNLLIKNGTNCYLKNDILFCHKGGDLKTDNQDEILIKVKNFFKKYPRFFSLLYNIFGASFVGVSAKKFLKDIKTEKIIINIGSGVKRLRDDVINVDIVPLGGVDMVADINDLPFEDETIDVVVNEFVLEHVKRPEVIVQEIYRVLKKGGQVYVSVPFFASFHSSPNDFYRWSKQGTRELLSDFEEIDIGVRCGPTSAVVYAISELLSTILSFGSIKLHQVFLIFFLVIFSPLSLLDYLIYKYPSSENIAYGFYFIGIKK